jgi:hypothetical protein
MGNPAEKTIRNPNLGPLLVKVRRAVNRNFGLQQKFSQDWEKALKFGV